LSLSGVSPVAMIQPMANPESTGSEIFRLADLSSQWGGTALWSLTFDLPGEKVNKLSKKVMEDFETKVLPKLEELGNQGRIEALVLLSGKPGNFVAGADIEMILAARSAEEAENLSRMGHKSADRWEDLPFPTVAVIDGPALGGGCELSLASTALVMSDSQAARIGLPETMLGIIPGMGGCIRLPRKVGIATALDLILTAKTLNGERAFKAGLADAFFPRQNFEESALRWVKSNLSALKSGKRLAKEPKLGGMGGVVGSLMENTPMGRALMFKKARDGVLSKTKGNYPAQPAAIDVVRAAGGRYGPRIRGQARDRALKIEAKTFGELAAGDVSKNLIKIFFLTEGVKKSKGLPPGVTAEAHIVHSAAVLGAGVMGGGIAQLLADKEIPVRMKDLTNQALTLGIQSATRVFQSALKKKKITKRQYVQKLNHIAPVTDFSGFHSTDVVVEAIVENMAVKKKVFQELESSIKDTCVVASNTSSLSVSEMQTAFKNPGRFVGMHFFNPVHRMPLVEVIRGKESSNEAVSTIFQFSKQLGKTPIVVKDSPGFLVNRILGPYMVEAVYLVADGAPIPDVDEAVVKFGMPMGPLELIDEVGIDVAEKVAHVFHDAFGERMKPADLNSKVIAAGRLGKKNLKGLYVYEAGGRQKKFDPEIYKILGVEPKSGKIPATEMVERCILVMINEAAMCLDEQVVASPEELDLGMIMGTGFPPFRGGLARYADTLGPAKIVELLKNYETKLGMRFKPSNAMLKRAQSGQKFY
jgi:3-hydroxyacyl-CoA dehydrogenase/enoyl-CoA hydratase/3-hydroxybutyryl-CoA epimerase